MFDVRPVNIAGDLDWEKIQKVSANYSLQKNKVASCETRVYREFYQEEEKQFRIRPGIAPRPIPRKAEVYVLGNKFESESLPIFNSSAEIFQEAKFEAELPYQQEIVAKESRVELSEAENNQEKIDRAFARSKFTRKHKTLKPKVYILGKEYEGGDFPIFSPPAEVFHKSFAENKEAAVKRGLVPKKILPRESSIQKNHSQAVKKIGVSLKEKFRKIFWFFYRCVFWPIVSFPFVISLKACRSVYRAFQKALPALWGIILWPFKASFGLAVMASGVFGALFKKIKKIAKKIIVWPLILSRSLVYFFRTIFPPRRKFAFSFANNFTSFSAVALLIIFTIGTTAFWNKGIFIQGKVLGASQEGYESINTALADLKKQNFEESIAGFNEANLKFSEASSELDKIGNLLIGPSRFIPFASKLSSGSNMIEAAKKLSSAGEELVKTTQAVARFKESEKLNNFSLLDLFRDTQAHLGMAQDNLKKANAFMEGVNVSDLPEDKREKFVTLKTTLPSAILAVDTFLNNELVLSDLLGGNGPRKYLFLFQNNQEMRATGGFIGSYGLLDIANGRIRNFFIDGIFNPDGQLKEKIIPPVPIQKISAAWSLHDSNWFPDFPASAKEAIVFYEKTGGPTTDGVITLTPTVLQKLLEITGPIEMKDYDVVLDSHNFIEKTQYEVEVDYDKTENKPKKILSDLAPLILDKLFSARDLQTIIRTLDVFMEALNQKQILIFSQNAEMEKIISEQGWSGEILSTPKDYLSVINSNINGFKTDGIIDEKIEHQAEIQDDGTIIDTVTVTRHHNGGNTGYAWWDKVNSDYLRVYVPLGSKFLSVEGQTREFTKPPLDYEALGFKKDARVEHEEAGITIDEATGTRIYEDFGKTVFANWTYVSPHESMTIKYRYQLPFSLNFGGSENSAQSYSLLLQKQSGSLGSEFESKIAFPHKYNIIWRSPEDLQLAENELQFKAVLDKDLFLGAAFTEKNLIISQ